MEDRRVFLPLLLSELRVLLVVLRNPEARRRIPKGDRESLACALVARFNRELKAA